MICKLAVISIRFYQRTLSPMLRRFGVRCRFYPTCSEYAVLALQQLGFLAGMEQTCRRLLRCRPDNFQSCVDFPTPKLQK
jgi:uncharacterized protein